MSAALPRVIHVASGREWRGGQHQVLLLARGLQQQDIDTTVVTGAGTELARRLEAARVPVAAARWTAGLDPRVVVRVAGLLSTRAILHAHDSHAHFLADVASRWRRVPLVVTRRVTAPIRSPRRYRRADAVIAISTAVRRELLAAGIDPGRIHLVPDAIDPVDATERPPDTASASGPGGSPLIACVAALTHEKGIDILLEAAALVHVTHPELRWRVIGEGCERPHLEAQRHRLGLDAVVDLPGAGPSAAAAFGHAAIAVQPSRSEGLGSAVLQALALGIPVIASDVGGLPDALAHGGGILVPPGLPAELAGAVQRLVDNAPESARLGAEGRVAASYFGVDRLVERTLDVYRSIAHYPGNR